MNTYNDHILFSITRTPEQDAAAERWLRAHDDAPDDVLAMVFGEAS